MHAKVKKDRFFCPVLGPDFDYSYRECLLPYNEMRLTMTVAQSSPSHRHQVKNVPVQKRRKWVRGLAKLKVEFVPVFGTLPICSATIRDMSRGGVRLVSMVPVESGTTIRMRLKSVHEARVVHVSRETTGQWAMGCAFTEEITSADLQQLLISHS
jgi:PilZ domain